MNQHSTVDTAVITYSGYVTKGSGVTAVGAGISQRIAESPEMITMADIGVIAGIAGVVIGLVVNVVANWRRDRREQEFHRLRIEALKNQCDSGLL
ncbi:hypothetical protein [uncultured Amphritea sp.]|uniref:hypothetical protein n=1 Tax=uncultured Amphritea sp. TaxID=981605 RepID=UPI00261E6A8F|nr:hypothetical protein [uncultured Amphritea sp.]